MARDLSDQLHFFNPNQLGDAVHVIGAGGIGSTVIQTLAKMGFPKIIIWDNDKLEERNIASEPPYSEKYVGLPKVEAATKMIEYLLGSEMKSTTAIPHFERATEKTQLEGYVICGVDSMRSRKAIFDAVKASSTKIPLFIDARSGGEMYQIFSFRPFDPRAASNYESWLFDDEDSLRLECGGNVAYTSNSIASLVTRNLTKSIKGEPVPFMISDNLATLERVVVM